MKKSRFTDEQIVTSLAVADRRGQTIGEICRGPRCFRSVVLQMAEAIPRDGRG